MKIRKMDVNDIEKIRNLDYLVFARKSPRKLENILSSLQMNNEGCFVAEKLINNEIIGYIFSRKWGKVAWIGTFGVHPDYRNQGIGKALFVSAFNFLKSRDYMIGLETVSTSSYNIALYLKQGFRLTTPTLVFSKVLKAKKNPIEKIKEENDCKIISKISDVVLKGLDYRIEGEILLKNNWGKVVVYGETEPIGFSLIDLTSAFEEEKVGATIRALVMEKNKEKDFIFFLKQIESYIYYQGLKKITISANASNVKVIDLILKQGYTLEYTLSRMIWNDDYKIAKGIDLSRWIM